MRIGGSRVLVVVAAVLLPSVLGGCSTDAPATTSDAGSSSGDDASTLGDGGITCKIDVAPSGDDGTCRAAGGGAPCKTITKALSLASSGCTVQVAAGTYATGEVFPLVVKDGVHLAGAGDTSVIDASTATIGAPFTVSCAGSSDAQKRAVVAISGAVGASLARVKVNGPSGAADVADVLVTGGTVDVGNVTVSGGEDGVYVTSDAKATIHDLIASSIGRSGIKPAGNSNVTIASTKISATKNGIEAMCAANATIASTEAFCNGNGVMVAGQAQVTVKSSNLHHNNAGIATKGATTQLTANDNQIVRNQYGVISVQAPLLLGSSTTPGNNVLVDAKVGLYLDRVADDTIALGDTWVANKDDADAQGKYGGTAKYIAAAPYCPKAPYGSLDVDPPAACAGNEDVAPGATYQNFVIVDPTVCAPAGPQVEVGSLTLASQ